MDLGAVRRKVLVLSTLTSLLLVTSLFPADSSAQEIEQDPAQSVEILRGDEPKEEKKETPAPRGTCAWQCERFRKQCETYCKREGRLPGIESRSRACREDCKQYKMACTRGCKGRAVAREVR